LLEIVKNLFEYSLIMSK